MPTLSLQRFGSVPTPGRALQDTRDDNINGIDCEHVDLQRRELGASARLWEKKRKKKKAVRNKQTDRQVGRTQKIPTAASQCAASIPVTYYPFIYLNLPPLTL